MRIKYLIFGIGIGLILSSLIFFATGRLSGDKADPQSFDISDEEVIERAYALGMVQIAGRNDSDNAENDNAENDNAENDIAVGNNADIGASDDNSEADDKSGIDTPASNDNGVEVTITNELLIEMAAEIGMVFPNEMLEDDVDSVSDEEAVPQEEIVNFRVIPGMTARAIAKLLQNNGIIDDATVFEEYLVAKGVQTILRSGYYSIPKGMPYSEIAVILSTKPKYR